MPLCHKIKSIVEDKYPNGTFMLASDFEAQVEANGIRYDYDFPLIILNNKLTERNEITRANSFNNQVDIMLTVLKPDEWDSTDAETNEIVEECKGIARKLMLNIFNLEEIRNEKGPFDLMPVMRDMNVFLSGCVAKARWNEYMVVSC